MTKTVTIRDVTAAMKLLPATPAWWLDAELCRVIQAGVEAGWLSRPSTSQVHWTEAGALAVDRDALSDRSMSRSIYRELRLSLRANGRYAMLWMETHEAVLLRSMMDAAPDEFEDRERAVSGLLKQARIKPTASMFRCWPVAGITPAATRRVLNKNSEQRQKTVA